MAKTREIRTQRLFRAVMFPDWTYEDIAAAEYRDGLIDKEVGVATVERTVRWYAAQVGIAVPARPPGPRPGRRPPP